MKLHTYMPFAALVAFTVAERVPRKLGLLNVFRNGL